MAVLGGLLVDWSQEVELLDDVARAEVEVLLHNADEVLISESFLYGSIGFNMDGERVGQTDGVRNLDEDSVAEASCYQGLGNISTVVGSRSVDLGGVLAGEGTTTVRSPTTIGIDDNLSSSETRVSLGSTDDE